MNDLAQKPAVRVGALMAALLAACVAFQLNASMLSPALVTMAKDLNTDDATISLSQTMFFTAAALFSLFLPRLSDIIGRKRVLIGMLVVMAIGTVIAALATNVEMLFVGRIIQGVTGPVVPVTLLMLRNEITEPKRYGTMLGIITAVNGGIAGIDALAGGWLVSNHGFRSVFWTMAVVAVIAIIFVILWAPESRPSKGTKMDWWGVLPLVVSIGSLLTFLNFLGAVNDSNWYIIWALPVLGLVSFWVFWVLESKLDAPLVPPRYLKQRSSWALLVTTLLTMTGVFAVVNGLVASLAQNATAGFDLEADLTSLAFLMPYAVAGWIVGPFAGRLAPTFGYLNVMRVGMIGTIVGTVVMAFVGVHSLPVLIITTILLGVTYAGIGNIMLNGLGIVLSPKDNPGFLPGLNAGAFNLGAGLSFAILPAVQLLFTVQGDPTSTTGYTAGMLAGAVISLVGFAISFLIPAPKDAEVKAPASVK
ncbi:MFS transporter [Mycetocola tolaasinivorans]|uniref:MFS transporter n=1 Tax=Mycetocola tolaasinivorans TaxID=76635 RepID=A0A3L7A6H0_9MICO|nr:MFS transporter [Mycetocola tolaasinivorans]RLP75734.1 MFS transporter [Mycetocola tolaasinivorans]